MIVFLYYEAVFVAVLLLTYCGHNAGRDAKYIDVGVGKSGTKKHQMLGTMAIELTVRN